jgi:hypothetical protein
MNRPRMQAANLPSAHIEAKSMMRAPLTGAMTVPSETRLVLYISAGYLQELETELKALSIPARYERPGINGVVLPRLVVTHPEHGEMDEVICASGWQLVGPNAEWWFEWWQWWQGSREPICRTRDIAQAARIIAQQLREESPDGR